MPKTTFFVIIFVFTFFQSFSQINWESHTIYDDKGKQNPHAICVGDIDGDTYPDVLTSSYGLRWLKNLDGEGNFGNSKSINTDYSGGYGIYNVSLADIDGDGYNDVVYTGDYMYWLKNLDGNGNFGTKINLGGTVNGVQRIQVVDIDNDGDMDIVYTRRTSYPSYQIVVLKNNGNGVFSSPQVILGSEFYKRFYVSDINGDSLHDIVYEDEDFVVYYQQNADGTFFLKENMGSTSNHMSSGIVNTGNVYAGDIDGDGDNDIVNFYENGGNNRSFKWFKNNNNVFASSQVLITLPASLNATNNSYFTFRLEDISGDGKVDIITQESNTNQIIWYKNLGNSTFGPAQIISNTILESKTTFIADVNGDGNKDILTGSAEYSTIWFDNSNGNGSTFTQHTINDYFGDSRLGDIGDINGDGIKDVLIMSSFGSKIGWYENSEGQGDFSKSVNVVSTSLVGSNSALLIDVDSDGNKDLVVSSRDYDNPNKIIWLANNGQGNFSNEQVLYNSGIYNHQLLGEDIDNDGDKDVIACRLGNAYNTIELEIFKHNGSGFDTPVNYTHAVKNFETIHVTDMDADGDADLLIFVYDAIRTYWIENTDGQGSFSAIHQVNIQNPSKTFSTGDFNNDGLKDIVFMYSTPQGLDYLRRVSINLDGTFGTPVNLMNLGGEANFGLMKLDDLDNDGDLDALVEDNNFNNNLVWFENLGNDTVIQHYISSLFFDDMDAFCFLEDINADGKIDFVASIGGETVWIENLGINQNIINGKVSLDMQDNGCTTGSVVAQQVLVSAIDGATSLSTFTQPNGNYALKVDTGNYITSVTTPFSNFTVNPETYTNQFENVGNQSNANFCLIPTLFFNDLEISFYPINDARPGFASTYSIVAKNKGTNTLTTSITLNYDNSKIQFVSADQTVASQTANSLVFSIDGLQPFQVFKSEINFQVNTIPATNIGDVIGFTIQNEVDSDLTPENNLVSYNQTIVGSYDPNDMLVLEGEEVHINNADEYLHYIIRFQNTGNYYAERVIVNTILDEKLDWKTMELESYSHSNRTEISDGNSVSIIFDAIYLPAVTVNEQDSNGYIAFKIKPKSSVVLGDIVSGVASIYFDYNPAIITNEVETEFVSFLGTPNSENKKITAYPNPVSNLLYLVNGNENLNAELYNSLGQLVLTVSDASTIDFSEMPIGVYLLKITTQSGKSEVKKIIKK